MKQAAIGLVLSGFVSTILIGCGGSSSNDEPLLSTKVALGEQLYSDKNLSFDGTQSCATCHNPDKGFVDDRTNDSSRDTGKGLVASAGSLGDNNTSIGDRNAPSAAYAAFSPLFHEETHDRPNKIMSDLDIGAYTGFCRRTVLGWT